MAIPSHDSIIWRRLLTATCSPQAGAYSNIVLSCVPSDLDPATNLFDNHLLCEALTVPDSDVKPHIVTPETCISACSTLIHELLALSNQLQSILSAVSLHMVVPRYIINSKTTTFLALPPPQNFQSPAGTSLSLLVFTSFQYKVWPSPSPA